MAAKFGPGPNLAAIFGPTGQNVAAIFGPTMPYYVRPRTKCRIHILSGRTIYGCYIWSRTKCGSDIWSGTKCFQLKCINIGIYFFINMTENMITQLSGQAHLV